MVHDDVLGEARLAPVYDLVTTAAYIPQDGMALTLNGYTRWPSAKELRRLGETRLGGTPARIRQIFQRIEQAMAETANALPSYVRRNSVFREVGRRMLEEWEKGAALSLRG